MDLSLAEIITQALGFLILVWVLKRLFWRPLLEGLEKRHQKIEGAFQEIESSKKEIETLRRDYESHLVKIEEEARAKLQQSVEEGRRIAREIQEKAREEAKASLSQSKDNLALEVQKARIELRRELVDLTLLATGKILREKMTEEKNREKILEMIEELETQK